jgi:hypothetical protein
MSEPQPKFGDAGLESVGLEPANQAQESRAARRLSATG